MEAQGALWSSAVRDWAELCGAAILPLQHAVLDAARVSRGTRVLDVGCGSGETLLVASLRGAEPAGIDLAPGLLTLAKERLPRADLRNGDMQDLPFKAGSFDAVLYVNSLMFPPDRARAVAEGARVLAPGGRLVVGAWAEPERCQLAPLFQAIMGLLPEVPEGGGPFVLGPPEATTSLLEGAGLKVLETVEADMPLRLMGEEALVRAMLAAGPAQAVVHMVGEEKVSAAVRKAAAAFRQEDGSYLMQNVVRVVAATNER